MDLDADRCYRAIASRDRRFEGRFVVGVTSTDVYCRPGCPARIPKRENVRFFACSAAAEEAGFRPCLRCRPDASPAVPAAMGTSVTVSRALRLIHSGELDDTGLEELADRLGVGARHLRRLFAKHLGASPTSIAHTRRVHFARKLIDETDLPMTQVAQHAGFASVRRFNDAVRDTFRRAPRDLRRAGRARAAGGDALSLRLPFKPPYDWPGIVGFLAPRAIPGVEEVTPLLYRRTVCAGGSMGTFTVRPGPARDASALQLSIDAPLAGAAGQLIHIVERVGRIFDLGADPLRIAAHLGRDAGLEARVRARPGLRVAGAWEGFELAVRTILGQQVSVKGATTLAGRIVARYGEPLPAPIGGLTHLFPTPAAIAGADPATFGLPRARAETLGLLAAAVRDGALRLDGSQPPEETIERLLEIKGIGPWSAQYIAMRALRDPDAFPASDLGLVRAYAPGTQLTPAALAERAEAWRPWRAYAAMHLWIGGSKAAPGSDPCISSVP